MIYLQRLFIASGITLLGSMGAVAAPLDFEFTQDVESKVEAYLQDILPEETVAQTALQARRQGRRSKTLTENTLNSFGYYAATVRMRVIEREGSPAASLIIDPGPKFTVGRLVLNFSDPKPRTDDIVALETRLPIKTGDVAIPSEIIDAQRILSSELRKLGYAFVDIEEPDVIGDRDAATISVRYNISSGPRVRFGTTDYTDDIYTKPAYLAKINPVQAGELYSPSTLALYNSRLSETRLFTKIQARLSQDSAGVNEDGDAIYNIRTMLEERPRNTLETGVDYDTFDGLGVTLELTRRNLTRRGDILTAEARIAEREYSLDMLWRSPNEVGYGRGLILSATALNEQTDAYEQSLGQIGTGYEVVGSTRLNYTYGVNYKYIEQIETDEIEAETFQTVSAYAGINIDRADSILDASKGWRANAEIAPTYALGDTEDAHYLRMLGHIRYYQPVDDNGKFVLATRLRLGAVIGTEVDNIPAEDRYYAGGGGSVRGYGYQTIGPVDEDGTATGGRALIDGSIEARYRYSDKIGVVAFIDGGEAFEEEYPAFSDMKLGAGIGARYQTPAGPVRLDVAVPLDPSDTDDDFQIYLSIGQAF